MSAGLLDEVLEAHGGAGRWRAASTIRASVRSGGLLLATRMPGNRLAAYEIEVEVAQQRASLAPFPAAGERVVLDRATVRHEDRQGNLVSERERPRERFFGLRGVPRNLRWDVLDAAYFAGYAMWNYLATPLLLTHDSVRTWEGEPWRAPGGETWRRIEARFDGTIATHSPRQSFYVGPDGLLRRHDYTAEVVGRWAKAAHMLSRHRAFDGLVFPTRRWVRPRGPGNRPAPFPTLVWIEIDRLEVTSG